MVFIKFNEATCIKMLEPRYHDRGTSRSFIFSPTFQVQLYLLLHHFSGIWAAIPPMVDTSL
jgi:hypothetical protein